MSSPKGTAIVTGAAQGIGREIALRLAEDGFDVAVNDISSKQEKLETLVAEIKEKGRQSSIQVADVSKEDEVQRMITDVVGAHGGLDVMVANAAILQPLQGITDLSAADWDRVMSVNARGPFLCYKYAGLQMIKQGRGGRIIGASSAAGKQAWPGLPAYTASKFAVRGLTQSAGKSEFTLFSNTGLKNGQIAQEFGPHGITVNAYAPGAVDTGMVPPGMDIDPAVLKAALATMAEQTIARTPLRRMGTVEDIANLVSFLASKESQFITGQAVSINGGIFFD